MIRVLPDTSVLFPALWKEHENHESAVRWLEAVRRQACSFVLSSHSVVELFSVMTRHPATRHIASHEVWQVIETTLLPDVTLVPLAPEQIVAKLRWCGANGLSGGILYDAIVAVAAEVAQVDLLLTYNPKHFLRVWPTAVGRIQSPDHALLPDSE